MQNSIFGLKRSIFGLKRRLLALHLRFERGVLRLQLRFVDPVFGFKRRPQLRKLSLRLQQLLSHRPRLLQPLSARLLLHEGPHALVGHGGGAIAQRWLPLLEYTCCECVLCWQPLR